MSYDTRSSSRRGPAPPIPGEMMITCGDCGCMIPEMDLNYHRAHECCAADEASAPSSSSISSTAAATTTSMASTIGTVSPTRTSQQESRYFRSPGTRTRRLASGRGQLDPPGELNQHDYGGVSLRVSRNNNNSSSNNNNEEQDDTASPHQRNYSTNENLGEWACPRCTLLNSTSKLHCDACHYRNNEIDNNDNHDSNMRMSRQEVSREETNIYHSSAGTSSQPALYVGTGALLGSVLGAAGAFVRGRPMSSGVLEGAMSGAVGGAFLQEVLRGPPTDASSAESNDHHAASRPATTEEVDIQEQISTELSSSSSSRSSRNQRTRTRNRTHSPPAVEQRGISPLGNGESNEDNENMRQPRRTVRVIRRRRNSDGYMTTIISGSGNGNTTTRRDQRRRRNTTAANTDPLLTFMLRSVLAGAGAPNIDGMGYEQLLQAFGDGSENLAADEHAIQSLPTAVINDPWRELPEDARSCAICLEEFQTKDVRKTLPCLHGFHEKCVDKWLRTNGVCPCCKHPVNQD